MNSPRQMAGKRLADLRKVFAGRGGNTFLIMENQADLPDVAKPAAADYRPLTQAIVRRQLSLSLRVAAIFAVILLGLPLINQWLPDIANVRIYGFTATWLLLAVLFYPITWLLSGWFIRDSDRIEAESADWKRLLKKDL